MIYFNIKTNNEVETVDELNPNDFESLKEYRAEKTRLYKEYSMCMSGVYTSSRCTKDWANR